MAYRIRYQLCIDYLAPGLGGMTAYPTAAGAQLAICPAGGAQTLEFNNSANNLLLAGSGAAQPGGNSLAAGDITTLLANMSADLSAQMNAQLGRLAQFPNGGT